MPRPIPREPPVTNAVFPVSVIRHLLAQNLGQMLGLRKSQVNRDEAGHGYLAARENLFLSYFVRTNSFRGQIKDVKVLGGHPVLVSAVQDALKNWKYAPASGETTVSLEFSFHP